jgi:Methyltransferase domain
MNLHYGCGMSTGQSWYNCDGSPTLRLQRLPLLGWLFRQLIKPRFPSDVHYGDIVSGLPLSPGSCDAVFCCHVLEHLALEDFRRALRNTHAYLKLGGGFG